MKNSTFQKTVLSLGEYLLAGRYDTIVPCYQEVLPVFVEGKAILIDGHDALRQALDNLQERLLAEGVIRSVGTIFGAEQTEQRRFRFIVDWHYHTSRRVAPKTSSIAYFCVHHNGECKVEMVEYRKLAFPNISGWKRFDVASPQNRIHAASGYLH